MMQYNGGDFQRHSYTCNSVEGIREIKKIFIEDKKPACKFSQNGNAE